MVSKTKIIPMRFASMKYWRYCSFVLVTAILFQRPHNPWYRRVARYRAFTPDIPVFCFGNLRIFCVYLRSLSDFFLSFVWDFFIAFSARILFHPLTFFWVISSPWRSLRSSNFSLGARASPALTHLYKIWHSARVCSFFSRLDAQAS